MTRKRFTRFCALLFVFSCLAALLWPGICMAGEQTYTVTAAELTQLEGNLARQETALLTALRLLDGQEQELTGLRIELQTALAELEKSKTEIERLKASLNIALDSIEKANQLLEAYEKEMKKEQTRLKRQRTLWQAAGALAVGWAAARAA